MLATSEGCLLRPSGVLDITRRSAAASGITAAAIAVSIVPGPTPFTRILYLANEMEVTLVS